MYFNLDSFHYSLDCIKFEILGFSEGLGPLFYQQFYLLTVALEVAIFIHSEIFGNFSVKTGAFFKNK